MRGLVLAALILVACWPGATWVAEVDGVAIPLSELEQLMSGRTEGISAEARETLIAGELDRLIGERVILNRADELAVEVTDSEVQELLGELFGDEAVPDDREFRDQIRRELRMERVALLDLGPHLEIPENEVARHFEEQQARYATEQKVEVRQIIVSDPMRARRVLRELKSGGDFEALARQYSLGPEARNGGLLPPYSRGELPDAFDQAFDLEPGELSDVVESPYGFHIFRVERHIPARTPTYEEVREDVRSELQGELFVTLRENWVRALRRKADIRINEPALESLR
jgi:parvulin-like peptidyl-prolyl isomerase